MSVLGSSTIQLPYAMTSALSNINLPLILFILFFIFCTVLFHFTALGRKLRYIGINELCAELTGFKKTRYLFIAFLVWQANSWRLARARDDKKRIAQAKAFKAARSAA